MSLGGSLDAFAPLVNEIFGDSPCLALQSGAIATAANGRWPAFHLTVGTPPQEFQVLPSLESSNIYFPSTFKTDLSGSWKANDSLAGWDLVKVREYEALTTNWHDTEWSVRLEPIDAIDGEESSVGLLGLGVDESQGLSLLQQAKRAGDIASLSYSYTAGAASRNQSASLVLGGYEPERGNRSSYPTLRDTFGIGEVYFDMIGGGNQLAMDLSMVFITYADSDNMGVQAMLDVPLKATINTTDPFIQFPQDICDCFISVFNLTYDARTNLYLVSPDSKLHQEKGTKISFVLGNSSRPGDETRITFPYSSFIFEAGRPWYDKPTTYFSIRPTTGDNSSTVILGRTFLQEAYLTVDYETRKFYVTQSIPVNELAKHKVILIHGLKLSGLDRYKTAVLYFGIVVMISMVPLFVLLMKQIVSEQRQYTQMLHIWEDFHVKHVHDWRNKRASRFAIWVSRLWKWKSS